MVPNTWSFSRNLFFAMDYRSTTLTRYSRATQDMNDPKTATDSPDRGDRSAGLELPRRTGSTRTSALASATRAGGSSGPSGGRLIPTQVFRPRLGRLVAPEDGRLDRPAR